MNNPDSIFLYCAGPYTTTDPVENTHKAIKLCNELREEGYVPFCPHLTLLWHAICPQPYRFWLDYDKQWLKKCDVLFRMPGVSSGADEEVNLANSLGIPVVYSKEELREKFPLAETTTAVISENVGTSEQPPTEGKRVTYDTKTAESVSYMIRNLPTIAIVGHAGCGKDKAASWFCDNTDLQYDFSTSEFFWVNVSRRPLIGLIEVKKSSLLRAELASEIDEYNKRDHGVALYVNMLEAGYNLLVGIRRWNELRRCLEKGLVDEVLWIEAESDILKDRTLNFTLHDLDGYGVAYSVVENDFGPVFFQRLESWSRDRKILLHKDIPGL